MAKGVTVDLIVDPKKALQGLDAASKKSQSTANFMKGLGTVALTGIAALGTAAVGVVTGLTAASKSAGEYAESVQNAASKTHLSTDAVQELQYASKVTGVEFGAIEGSLTKLTKAVGNAAAGNKKTAAAFDELGVSTVDANGNLRASTDIYSDVISALGQVSNPTERDILAMQLLGKSATQLNPLIDGSAGSLADLAAQAHQAGAVLSGDALNGLSSVDDAFDRLQLGVGAAKNALGLVLMPALTELGDTGSGLLGEFTNAILNANGDMSKAAPAIGAVVGKAAQFLLTQIPVFLEVGTSIVSSIITGIAEQGPSIITAAIPVLLGFVTTLLGQLPMLLDAGAKILIALVTGIADALPTLIPAAVHAVISLVSTLIDNLPLILDAGLQLLTGLATGILQALPILIRSLPSIILGLVNFLVGAIPTIIQTGVTLLTSLVTALPEIITAITTAIPEIIVGLVTAFTDPDSLSAVISAGITLFTALIGALPQIITAIVGAVPQIVQGLIKAFTDPKFIKQMSAVGGQLIGGLWQGIKGTGDWLWKQISGFFGDQIDRLRDFLGIHSPSTLIATLIGEPMGMGVAPGFVSGLVGSSGSMSSALSSVASGLSGSVALDARATVAAGAGFSGGPGGGVTVINNTFPNFLGFDKAGTARAIDRVMRSGRRTGDVSSGWAVS